MQAAAPAIERKGEVEVAASWSLTNRLEGSAAYSPVNHLLVRGAFSVKGALPKGPSDDFNLNNQYELGVGTYWPVGKHLLVGGLLGFGQAHSQAQYARDYPLFTLPTDRPPPFQFDAIYAKYSAETYLTATPIPSVSVGLAYRLVQLRLTDVTDAGVPVTAAPILRHEPMVYLRCRPQFIAGGLVQVQYAAGFSKTDGYNDRVSSGRNEAVEQFQVAHGYMSVGVAIYPHLLWRAKP